MNDKADGTLSVNNTSSPEELDKPKYSEDNSANGHQEHDPKP
jgi:hypothetical protein